VRRTAITLTAFALTLAACGGGDASTDEVATLDETATTTSSTTPQQAEVAIDEAILDYVQCLRDEGLEVQDPDLSIDGPLGLRKQFVEEDGVTISDEVRAAFDACDDMRADMGSRFDDVDLSDTEDRLLAFAQCMRDEGFTDFPDPDLSVWAPGAGLGPGNGPFGTVLTDLREDPANAAGIETCQALYGGAGTGGSGTGE
jgi:hypothetical protein